MVSTINSLDIEAPQMTPPFQAELVADMVSVEQWSRTYPERNEEQWSQLTRAWIRETIALSCAWCFTPLLYFDTDGRTSFRVK